MRRYGHLAGPAVFAPVFISSPESGESFTCTEDGLGGLRAVRDRTVELWATVGILAFGVVVSSGMTAVGFAMRRAADVERR